MIEPPKLFTDARREYDMQEVELLGKFAIDCQLQNRRDIRLAFERLLEVIGSPQFHQDFRLLYDYVMKCHQERRMAYTLSTLNRGCPDLENSSNLSILCFTSYGGPLGQAPSKLNLQQSHNINGSKGMWMNGEVANQQRLNNSSGNPLQHHHTYNYGFNQQPPPLTTQFPHQRIPSGLSSRNPSMTMIDHSKHPHAPRPPAHHFIRQPGHNFNNPCMLPNVGNASVFQRRFTSPATVNTAVHIHNQPNNIIPNNANALRSWHFRSPVRRPGDVQQLSPSKPIVMNPGFMGGAPNDSTSPPRPDANFQQDSYQKNSPSKLSSISARTDAELEEQMKNQQLQSTAPADRPKKANGDKQLHQTQSSGIGKSKAAKRAVEFLKNRAINRAAGNLRAANQDAPKDIRTAQVTVDIPMTSVPSKNNDNLEEDQTVHGASSSSTPRSGPIVASSDVAPDTEKQTAVNMPIRPPTQATHAKHQVKSALTSTINETAQQLQAKGPSTANQHHATHQRILDAVQQKLQSYQQQQHQQELMELAETAISHESEVLERQLFAQFLVDMAD